MKSILLVLSSVLVVGCMRPIPPEPPKPQVIEIPPQPPIQKVDEPKVVMPEVEEEVPAPTETWSTPEAESKRLQNAETLQKAIEEAARRGDCLCAPGDPLCHCL